MLKPFFPELVMSTDLLSLEHPSVLLFCLKIISRSMHLFQRMNPMLNFICIWPVELRGTRNIRKLKK